ncbi:MAG: lactate racemase domain-containing protein [Planctomycetaceae bacterium]
MSLPRMMRVRQRFDAPRLEDVARATRDELQRIDVAGRVQPGETVAITVGSRGISNIAEITRAIVQWVKEIGGIPFIVPAMGSHGGGTAEGQRGVIEGYGVTEAYVGCEIRSSMETVVVDQTPQGFPVHFDRHAWEARHVIVAGRIKPHTRFVGPIESGLHKMMLIGLGKHEGAKIYHRAIQDHSFSDIIHAVAHVVLERCRVLCGIAMVENALDETALIEAVRPERFFEREQALLTQARLWLPQLPFRDCDLLIVDEIGKDISGTGMDTNVVGRKYNDHEATAHDDTNCRRIFVRGLTEKTHGNATGLGLAEFTNRRTVDAMDVEITKVNCVTAGHPTGAMIPIWYETDREAIAAALSTAGLTPPEQSRVMHITNTLRLEELLVSEAYRNELSARDDLEVVSAPTDMAIDATGNLASVIAGAHR